MLSLVSAYLGDSSRCCPSTTRAHMGDHLINSCGPDVEDIEPVIVNTSGPPMLPEF